MVETTGEKIPVLVIDKIDRKLSGSDSVKKAVKLARFDGNEIDSNKKQDRLKALIGDELHGSSSEDKSDLSVYGKLFNNPDEKDREQRIEKFKRELLYPSVLINKDNIPNSCFALQLRSQSDGRLVQFNWNSVVDISNESKRKREETIYDNQKNLWICGWIIWHRQKQNIRLGLNIMF
jgi:hypothetical protein